MRRRPGWMAGLLAVILALLCAWPAAAESPSDYNRNVPQLLREGHLYADSAVLVDADNGNVLFAKNARER